MLFELRNSTPDVTDAWIETRDLFLSGDVRASWNAANAHRGKGRLLSANDYLLNIEVARACSANGTYFALARRAFALFPNNPLVQLYQARVLLNQSRLTECIEFLLSLEDTLGQTHPTFWRSELASIYASTGFEASCHRWLDGLQNELAADDPFTLYTRSCAYQSLQQWEQAIDLAEQCVAKAPNWTRARGYLAHCVLARGDIARAEHHIHEATRSGYQESIVELTDAMLAMSLGRWDEARPKLQTLLGNWPQADFSKRVRRTLCILLVELGDYEQARRVADGQAERMALPSIPERAKGKHCYISLPLVAQNRDQCVPTSVAMAAHPQGHSLDPDSLYQEMHGRAGTPLWRMREWSQAHGFHTIPIKLEREAVVAILEKGVPLIGTIEWPFNSHVEVVCGFNDDLDTFYVRDPGHWAPFALPWEMIRDRYQMHAGLLAVIDMRNDEAVRTAHTWRSDETIALMDLSVAIATADVVTAEEAYSRITDDSTAAYMRDSYAVNVAISLATFRERMRLISHDDSAPATARFRAVMSLGADDSDGTLSKLIEQDKSKSFRPSTRRYLHLLRLMHDGQWSSAKQTVDRLLIRGGSNAHFWDLKSDVLAQLGDHDGSADALNRAIELQPLRSATREKALNRAIYRLTLTEYLSEMDSLLAEDPDDKGLLIGRAAALQDGPDGEVYEQAAFDAIRWFPRMQTAYDAILNWYAMQGRMDLRESLLAKAREKLPEVYSEADASPDSSASKLPDEKGELLSLAGNNNHPQHSAALARLRELERANSLLWYEVARLAAYRLLNPDRVDGNLDEPSSVLPQDPPGAPHWFADVLCGVVTDSVPSVPTARAIQEWLITTVPNFREHAELWFKRVLLLEHSMQMELALTELQQLLDRYPAMSSALYRMGVVKSRQQDYPAAQTYFLKALEVNPGLLGAMYELRRVHETLGQREEALGCTQMLRKKYPYSVTYLRDECLAILELQSRDAAERVLADVSERFPKDRIEVLHARLDIASSNTDKARSALSQIALSPDQDDDSFEDCLQAKLDVALIQNESQEVIELCDSGLERWPDSTYLKQLKAEHYARIDPKEGLSLLREVLSEGPPQFATAWQYLNASDQQPDSAARGVLLATRPERRQRLAEVFADVMCQPEYLHDNESFLRWSLEQFPDSNVLRYRLVYHYNITRQTSRAIRLAKELYERDPDDPDAARMLGRCLIDKDTKAALTYLEKACQQNRSVDYLFDLARCHQVERNIKRAQELHWEILEQNPYVGASWVGLYVSKASPERLWPYVQPMLDYGYGVDDEYFHVAVVKAAIELGKTLPPSWFQFALRRWDILRTHPGFQDERTRLKRALLVWRLKRPQDVTADMQVPGGSLDSLIARYWWPRCEWILAE